MELYSLLEQVKIEATSDTLKKAEEQLAHYINELIQTDFSKLVHLLYRVDVEEHQLKSLLQREKDKDAAVIIAALIIKRELEKKEARTAAKQNPPIDEDEKW